jgi:hypothetical protein
MSTSRNTGKNHSTPWEIKRIGIALAAYAPPLDVFAEQLSSIQEQTFTQWTCWITLDSPLDPLRKEPKLAPFFKDPRFIWSENPTRLGHKKNFERSMNLAAADSSVDAIACSDQDDLWYPRKLHRCVEELQRIGPNSLVHSDMHVLNADGTIAARTGWQLEHRGVHNASVETLLIRNVVAGCAMLIDANLVRNYPTIPDAFDYHDHWYAITAAAHCGAHPIYEPLYAYRQHGGNVAGLSEFRGLFRSKSLNASCASLIKETIKRSRKSLMMTQALVHAQICKHDAEKLGAHQLTKSKVSRGLAMILLAARSYKNDLPLLRASIARGVGTILLRGGS